MFPLYNFVRKTTGNPDDDLIIIKLKKLFACTIGLPSSGKNQNQFAGIGSWPQAPDDQTITQSPILRPLTPLNRGVRCWRSVCQMTCKDLGAYLLQVEMLKVLLQKIHLKDIYFAMFFLVCVFIIGHANWNALNPSLPYQRSRPVALPCP